MGKESGFVGRLRAFGRATGGNVAMMFGLSLLPLAIAAGAGLDFANAAMVRNQMQDAVDAAALAYGANKVSPDPTALAKSVFTANYKGPGSPNIQTTPGTNALQITADYSVPTTILKMVGQPNIGVHVATNVVWGQTKLWVALVLDNTGSMCEPDNNPCPNDTNANIKINALKTASHNLLTTLQNVSANPGDVQVAIIPFAKDVKIASPDSSASWIDWTDWDSPPTVSPYNFSAPGSSVGPGSNCPWSSGLGCVSTAGGSSSASKVPSSGLICPGSLGSGTPGGSGHHFQGCYDSVFTRTTTTTVTQVNTTTITQGCSQKGTQTVSCNNPNSSTSNGTPQTVQNTANGYTGDSGPTVTTTPVNGTPSTGTKSCNNSNPKTCTWTITTINTSTVVTVTKTGTTPYSHTWASRAHSNWTGCIMDRGPMAISGGDVPGNDFDTNAGYLDSSGSPSPWAPTSSSAQSRFPAEINDSCPVATVMPLNHVWDSTTDTSTNKNQNLSYQIDSMQPNGGTNQGVGLAHGMQALTDGVPYNAGTLPSGTTRYIILLSDGLNTLDRWYGNGSAQSTSIDTREKAACDNAKTQGIVIYTVFVDLNGTQGSSSALQYCAGSVPGVSDSSKYFDLTTSGSIITAFAQIAQQITSLRVAS